MTLATATRPARQAPRPPAPAHARFPARPATPGWPVTGQDRQAVLARLAAPPFARDNPDSRSARQRGLRLLLDWLEDQPGTTWQQRWLASGAYQAGLAWRQ